MKRSHFEAPAPCTVDRATEQAADSKKVLVINAIRYKYSADSPILQKIESVKKMKAAAEDLAERHEKKRKLYKRLRSTAPMTAWGRALVSPANEHLDLV